jgi:hypothetical protein
VEQGRQHQPHGSGRRRHPGHYNKNVSAPRYEAPDPDSVGGVPDSAQAAAYYGEHPLFPPFNPSAPPLSPSEEKERTERAIDNYEKLFFKAHRVRRRRRLAEVLLHWQQQFAELHWDRWFDDGHIVHFQENTYNYYNEVQEEPVDWTRKAHEYWSWIWKIVEFLQNFFEFIWITKHFWTYPAAAVLVAEKSGIADKIRIIYTGSNETSSAETPSSPGPAPEPGLLEWQ